MLNTTDRDRGECAAVVQDPHHCAARVEPHAAKPPILQDWQRWQVERARKVLAGAIPPDTPEGIAYPHSWRMGQLEVATQGLLNVIAALTGEVN